MYFHTPMLCIVCMYVLLTSLPFVRTAKNESIVNVCVFFALMHVCGQERRMYIKLCFVFLYI